jgi:diguanylate cyclase (GGDEF)-like protein/PAS domain S-box-containing protein
VIQKVLQALIIPMVLIGLLTFMFVQMQSHNIKQHQQINEHLRYLKQYDAMLSQDVIRLRQGVLKHYDTLAYAWNRIDYSVAALNQGEARIYQIGDQAIDDDYEQLINLYDKSKAAMERFKLNNTLLRNSLEYLPTEMLEVHLLLEEKKLITIQLMLDNAYRDTYAYVTTADDSWRREAVMHLAILAELIGGQSKAVTTKIQAIIKHLEVLLKSNTEVLNIIAGIKQLNTVGAEEKLHKSYMAYYQSISEGGDEYRLSMYTISVALVIYLAYILIQLSRNTMATYRKKEQLQVTFNSISDGVVTTDAAGIIEAMNPVAEQMLGISDDEALGKHIDQICELKDDVSREKRENPIYRCLRKKETISMPEGAILESGEGDIVIKESASPMFDDKGRVIGAVAVLENITQARQLSRKLEWQAFHDPLTELPNKRDFELKLDEVLASSEFENIDSALLFVDLDNFKIVNDTCGHVAGNELLKQISFKMKQLVRKSDTLARIGGDEFALLLMTCNLQQARAAAEKILQLITDFEFVWEKRGFSIGASIGLTPIYAGKHSKKDIIKAADAACYAAKHGGRNRIHVGEPGDEEMVRRKGEMQWINKLTNAMKENKLVLYWQEAVPVIKGAKTSSHYEFLVRIQGNENELIPPAKFLPSAERYRQTPAVDRWVIRNIFSRFAELQQQLGSQPIFSINLSGLSLSDDDLFEYIQDELQQWRVKPECICFEITEVAAIENMASTAQLINGLKKLGCRFALDDFGAGMSSFSYLKNLPVDFLKIDGSFITEVMHDHLAETITSSIIHIGQALNIKTVAKSVESDEILHKMQEMGVDFVQGYSVSSPVPVSEAH